MRRGLRGAGAAATSAAIRAELVSSSLWSMTISSSGVTVWASSARTAATRKDVRFFVGITTETVSVSAAGAVSVRAKAQLIPRLSPARARRPP